MVRRYPYEKMKDYYIRHPEQYEKLKKMAAINNKKYHDLDRENWNIKANIRNKRRWQKRRLEIFKLLGGKCANPYSIDHSSFEKNPNYLRCLQIDHVNGNGSRENKTFKNYLQHQKYILEQIKSGSKDYQLLCANCNWIKRIEKNEFPSSI